MSNLRPWLEGFAAAVVAALLVWSMTPRAEGDGAPGGAKPENIISVATGSGPAPSPPVVSDVAPRSIARPSAAEPATTAPVLLFGDISDREGEPVAASITFGPDPFDRKPAGTTAVAGKYSVFGLRAGEWTATVACTGYKKLVKTIQIPRGPARVREDFVMDRSLLIPVRIVLEDGEPFEKYMKGACRTFSSLGYACTVVATAGAPPARIPIVGELATAYGIGRFRTASNSRLLDGRKDGADGLLELFENPPCYASLVLGSYVIATTPVPSGAESITIIVPGKTVDASLGKIIVRVADSTTGAPADRAIVSLSTANMMLPMARDDGSPGTRVAEKLLPGEYTVSISYLKTSICHQRVTLAPGETVDLGTIDVGRSFTIRGRVVDADGAGVACTLPIVNLGGGQRAGWFSRHSLVADADGKFSIHVAPGRYQIFPSLPEYARTCAWIDTAVDPEKEIVIRLSRGTPVLLRYTIERRDPVWLNILGQDGQCIWSCESGDREEDILRLVPGVYSLQIEDLVGLRRTIPLTVGSEPVSIDVTW
jgi:hypothetical protein